MALYNVESPGGYQLTGRTIPGVDILGSKNGYSLSRPWLFEDFDQLSFHEVSEEEYKKQLAMFHSGRYEYVVEDTEFDMEEHNRLLQDTKEEVVAIRKRQSEAQKEMDKLEAELMEKWTKEKAEGKIPMDKVEALLNGMRPFPQLCTTQDVCMLNQRKYGCAKLELIRSGDIQGHEPPERQCLESHSKRRRRAQGKRCGDDSGGYEIGDRCSS